MTAGLMVQESAVANVLGGEPVLGRNLQPGQLHKLVQSGLSVQAASQLKAHLNVSNRELAFLMGSSERTLERRQKFLSPMESDRLYRVARITARAEEVLGQVESALAWLKEPMAALEDQAPLDLLDTDAGTVMVDELLSRIEHGIFV
jgi:putative toxin-antitoxin system antitoxin component (TIGR02293 family)